MSHTGGCLCGAVTYQIASEISETGACHCQMCRKWSGGVYLGIQVAGDKMTISGDQLETFTSSPWAERGFCKTCGSSLFYRVTAPGPHNGTYHVGMGTLDDSDGIIMTGEIYIDQKPGGYNFAEDTHKMTAAEVMAMFAPPEAV